MFDDEGPTTSNALRADSGVSDGNVSLNNDEETNDNETGSDATQILSNISEKHQRGEQQTTSGGLTSKERQLRLMRKQREREREREREQQQDETSVENTNTNSGERGGDVVNTNSNCLLLPSDADGVTST